MLSAHTVAINGQHPLLKQQKRENDRRNYFNISLHESYVAGLGSNSQALNLSSDSQLPVLISPALCLFVQVHLSIHWTMISSGL